jgi:methyl coenzyme M reductase subunit C-like uncharacterized protein (methanogenesis marker protein 7)
MRKDNMKGKKKFRTTKEILRDLRVKKMLMSLKDIEEVDLEGCNVKLNFKSYEERIKDNELQDDFINFLNENKDSIFVARHEKSYMQKDITYMYELEGVEKWTFVSSDLILIGDSDGE